MTRELAIEILSTRDNQGMPITWQNGFVEAYDMAIRSLEAWESLYEKTAEWEAEALCEVEKHIHDEDVGEWRKWSHILTERTAFKCDAMKYLKEMEE